jgi:hypothetical protein
MVVLLLLTLSVIIHHFSVMHKEHGYLLIVKGREVKGIDIS